MLAVRKCAATRDGAADQADIEGSEGGISIQGGIAGKAARGAQQTYKHCPKVSHHSHDLRWSFLLFKVVKLILNTQCL